MTPIITATDIKKVFQNGDVATMALRGVSLEIHKGEFVAIMGKSGAGKSTLLYQLSLLDTPTSGVIMLDGVTVSALTREERTRFRLERLGYIFQDYALVPELTATENVVIPLLMQGVSLSSAVTRAEKALASVGLSNRIKNLPSQLSGGEQQRVSIARAIVHAPSILFADEPTANLDTETSRRVLDIFKTLNDAGQTIVMVTHEHEYGRMADRIISLIDGVITDPL